MDADAVGDLFGAEEVNRFSQAIIWSPFGSPRNWLYLLWPYRRWLKILSVAACLTWNDFSFVMVMKGLGKWRCACQSGSSVTELRTTIHGGIRNGGNYGDKILVAVVLLGYDCDRFIKVATSNFEIGRKQAILVYLLEFIVQV